MVALMDVCERCGGRGVIWNGEREVRCQGVAHRIPKPEPIPLSEELWQRYQARR